MNYTKIKEAVFIKRPNRFIAHVLIEGSEEIVHVKNTGRCKELLTEGAKVILEESNNSNRKTKYSVIAVYKGNRLVNIDSQAPNAVAAEALKAGKIKEIGIVDFLKREVPFGNSRFDIYYEKQEKRGFIEVKGVTLEENGVTMFPDAPSERAVKHSKELMLAKEQGYEAAILFVIQMKGAKSFQPHWEKDKKFSETLIEAYKSGVSVLVYDCTVTNNSITLRQKVPKVLLEKAISN